MTAEDEFVLALTTVRATYGPISASEADLKEIVSTEESRVADAVVIAELIAARLAAAQAALPTAPIPATSATLVDRGTAPSFPTPIPFPTTTNGSNPPLSVADLLDGMLAQERRDVRKPASG